MCVYQVNWSFQSNFKFAYILHTYFFNERQMPQKAATCRNVKNKTLIGTFFCVCWFIAQWNSLCVHFEYWYRTGVAQNLLSVLHCIPQCKGSQLCSAWQEASHFEYLLREKRAWVCVEHLIMKEEQSNSCRQVLKSIPLASYCICYRCIPMRLPGWKQSPLLCCTAVKIVNTVLPRLLWYVHYVAFENMNL